MQTNFENVNGYDVQIYTGKTNSGRITCAAQFGKYNTGNGYNSFSFSMYEDPRIALITSPPNTRATEKAIQEIHTAGLLKFAQMKQEGTLPAAKVNPLDTIKPGQILRFVGYGKEMERLAIYECSEAQGFKVVNLETLKLSIHNHIKPRTNTNAIGVYWTEGETVDLETVNKALREAQEKAKADTQAKDEATAARTIQRNKDIQTGKQVLPAIPAGMTHVIEAHLRQNDSDPMTDYFSSSTADVEYLAFSTHDRNLFDEMRKAAGNSNNPDINKYSTKPIKPADSTREDWTPKDEHREGYSGGHGYYLGDSKYSGWIIEKKRIGSTFESTLDTLEKIQIAIAQGKCSIPTNTESTPEPTTEPILTGSIQVIDYSEKAIAVIGEGTRAIKDHLKSLGGRFNFRLTCGAGWIFPKTKTPEVIKLLKKMKESKDQETAPDFSEKWDNIDEPATPLTPALSPAYIDLL